MLIPDDASAAIEAGMNPGFAADGAPNLPDASQKRRLTVVDPRLKARQRVHAMAISGLGIAGLTVATLLQIGGHPASLTAIALFCVFFLLAGCGVTVGFHRYFTHRAFRASPAVKIALGIFGSMSGQGPVVYWAAVHRMHHMHADKTGDPHSPNLHGDRLGERARGAFHAFVGWTMNHDIPNSNVFSRDLLSDKTVMWISRHYYVWLLMGWILPAIMGGLITQTAYGALEGLLWGGLIRMFAANSGLYAVAFICHSSAFGSRNYATEDRSRNSLWLAIPSLGDSWHNNHHAFPRAAIVGLRWWQLDISGYVIRLLEMCGLITEVCRAEPDEFSPSRRA